MPLSGKTRFVGHVLVSFGICAALLCADSAFARNRKHQKKKREGHCGFVIADLDNLSYYTPNTPRFECYRSERSAEKHGFEPFNNVPQPPPGLHDKKGIFVGAPNTASDEKINVCSGSTEVTFSYNGSGNVMVYLVSANNFYPFMEGRGPINQRKTSLDLPPGTYGFYVYATVPLMRDNQWMLYAKYKGDDSTVCGESQ